MGKLQRQLADAQNDARRAGCRRILFGKPGKNWSSCPGNDTCATNGGPVGCFSYSNDASLLLPSTAMTASTRSIQP